MPTSPDPSQLLMLVDYSFFLPIASCVRVQVAVGYLLTKATTSFLASCLFFQPQVITSAHGFQLGKEYRHVGVGIQPGGAIASVTPNPSHSSYPGRNFLGRKAISTVMSGPEAGLQGKRIQMRKGKNTVNRPTCDVCTCLEQTQTFSCKKKWESCFTAKCWRNVFPLWVPNGSSVPREQSDHKMLHLQLYTCWSWRQGRKGFRIQHVGQILGLSCIPDHIMKDFCRKDKKKGNEKTWMQTQS